MNNKIKSIAMIAAVILCAALFYWVIVQEESQQAKPEEVSESPPLSYIGNSLSEEKNGKKVWDLTAEFIEVDPVTNNTLLKNAKGVFYQENGETVSVQSPRAVYDVKQRNVILTEGVKTISSNGTVLDADELQWDSTKEIFNVNGHVKLTKEDTILTGDRLEAFDSFSKFKVIGNAHIIKGGKTP